MIDWTRPELYTHRERTDDEIVRVHVIPEWIKNSHYRVYIEWKSGECGWCLLNSDQIIPKSRKPRVVEGWMQCELPKSPNFPSTESLYLDNTYGKGVTIELRPGMGFFLYTDGGPGGICGQSMDITCPHANLFTFDCEESLNKFVENFKGRNKKCRIWFGVVDKYTSGGQFSIGTVRNKNTGDDHCVIK